MDINKLIELVNPLHVSRTRPDADIPGIVQDSRNVTEGCAFIAIRGTEVDGHMFLEDAIYQGAKVLICEESYYTDAPGVCVMEVESTRAIVGKLAQAFADNPGEKLRIVGITGTNGKTTTATLVYQVLKAAGKKASLLGTVSKKILDQELESSLTTSGPIELASDMQKMVDSYCEFLVMEVSSHALAQSRVAGFNFEVGAFTNLSHDHLDYHNTVEEYAKAKKILFEKLDDSATAIINMDDEYGPFMGTDIQAEVIEFGFKNERNHILQNSADGLTLIVNGVHIKSPLVGTFNAYNVGEAFLICQALGIEQDVIVEALSEATGASGRMETVQVEGDDLPLVIVDYAHTPDALENVLSTLSELKEDDQQLTVIFGAGGDRDPMKRPEMAIAAENLADNVVVTSDNPRFEDPAAIIDDIMKGFREPGSVTKIISREDAIAETIAHATAKEIILIAGKGHEDYQDVKGTKHPFDDRVKARRALELKSGGTA
ncbi:MAG TPA: UDP-N-acetylmuramoyl-L-alanyl-D-glutamate--2,6-diaminopimelate ligase [Balneolaceae bacterium]|nr:UDP-N-acetylmuramoyl-L-alanyl-D-glutamate--2,6-diaminopimelate ligase [Balneolaceae bacterium]